MREIERKFLVKYLPDLDKIAPIRYERYFLSNENNLQIRVQKKKEDYEIEKKRRINDLEHEKTKEKITKQQFIELTKQCKKCMIRDSYLINEKPNITIKIYHGRYEGLVRAEIEYENKEDMDKYDLPLWIGEEITGSNLANDVNLIELSREEFLEEKARLESTVSYHLRPCKIEDFDFLFEIKKQNFKWYVDKIWGWKEEEQKERLKNDLKKHLLHKKIIMIGDIQAGVYVTHITEEGEFFINEISLLKEYQNKGIGTRILTKQLEENSKNKINTVLQVFKENKAKRLYERLGFKIYNETETHYQMRKQFAN